MNDSDQFLLDFQDRELPSLDNFIVGSNTEVVGILRELQLGMGPTFVYIHGPKGAGVTHLLKSLVPEQALKVPLLDSAVKLYTVDDVDDLDPGWCRQLLALQNSVRNTPGAHLVCGGKLPARDLNLPDVVKSRLAWGLSYVITPLSEEARMEELARQAQLRGFEMTSEMQHWLAVSVARDMRTLTRVLEEVDHLGLVKKRKVTLPILREAVAILAERSAGAQNTAE